MALVCIVVAGVNVYASQRGIPDSVVKDVLPALLLELGLYGALVFTGARSRFRWPVSPAAIAAILVVLSSVPWMLYGHSANGWLLLAIVIPAAFWYAVLPVTVITDLAMFAYLGGVILMKGGLFRQIYPDAMPGLRVDFLGHLMWIRLGVSVMILLRRMERIDFGFLPSSRDLKIGFKWFAIGLPGAFVVGSSFGIMQLGTPKAAAWQLPILAVGAFIGFYCVVALSEEVFLRRMIFRWLNQVLGSESGALAVTTIISGAVHLGFRGPFNWKFALLSAAVHYCFGRAYLESGSLRAGMVAHALTATTWLTVFAKSA